MVRGLGGGIGPAATVSYALGYHANEAMKNKYYNPKK